jgi:hypothetical protein
MDPAKFKAPFLRKEEIWERADKLRNQNVSGQSFPVDVLGMAEFDLGLELVPAYGLRQQCDTEAILLGDLKTILVDKESFTNPKQEYRLRFSVAHEIGHLVLHGDVYDKIRPPSADAWLNFISELPEDQYSFLEYHANEFAGRLWLQPGSHFRRIWHVATPRGELLATGEFRCRHRRFKFVRNTWLRSPAGTDASPSLDYGRSDRGGYRFVLLFAL